MVRTVNDLFLRVSLESIMEGIGDICNTNVEVLCVSTGEEYWSKPTPST